MLFPGGGPRSATATCCLVPANVAARRPRLRAVGESRAQPAPVRCPRAASGLRHRRLRLPLCGLERPCCLHRVLSKQGDSRAPGPCCPLPGVLARPAGAPGRDTPGAALHCQNTGGTETLSFSRQWSRGTGLPCDGPLRVFPLSFLSLQPLLGRTLSFQDPNALRCPLPSLCHLCKSGSLSSVAPQSASPHCVPASLALKLCRL